MCIRDRSAALKTGIHNSTYEIIVTLDGDCQNDPKDIPAMLEKFTNHSENNLLMIGGVRVNRKDNLGKKINDVSASDEVFNKDYNESVSILNSLVDNLSLRLFDKFFNVN